MESSKWCGFWILWGFQTTRLNNTNSTSLLRKWNDNAEKRNEKKEENNDKHWEKRKSVMYTLAEEWEWVREESNKSENNLNACVAIKSKISDKIYCPRCFRFNIFFTEFENIGIGAEDGARRKWVKQLCDAEMLVDFVKFCFHLVKQAVLPVIALAKCFLSNNKGNELNK